MAEGLGSRSRERRVSLGCTSVDLREVSWLRLIIDDCLSVGDRGDAERGSFWIRVTVLVEAVRDFGFPEDKLSNHG